MLALVEESMNYPVSERIDSKLRYSEEILPGEVSLVCLVQTSEPLIESLYLRSGETRLLKNILNLLCLEVE